MPSSKQSHNKSTPSGDTPKLIARYSLLVSFSLLILVGGLIVAAATSVSAQTGTEPTPLPLFALPDARQARYAASNSIALASDGQTLVAANWLNNTISVVKPLQGTAFTEIPIGNDPRTVAMTPDSTQVVVTNRGDDTLAVVGLGDLTVSSPIPLGGVWPYGVVVDSGNIAYVSLEGSSEIAVVDLASGQVTHRIRVAAYPAGLALWGDFLYVTHFWSGQVTLIYLPQMRVVQTIDTGLDTSISQSIEIDVSRGLAYLPQSRSNAQNRALTYDSAVFPVVTALDLHMLSSVRQRRIALDTADRPVNMPFAAALDRFRQWLYVVNAGSDDLSVIDLNTGLARTHINVGANPRGVLLNRDNTYLFVDNALDGTITVIETATGRLVNTIPISNFTVSADTLLGAQFFYSAADPRLSADHWLSCASCHFDGESDGRTWQGFPDGPRNTPLLYNLLETAPYNASDTWDELADVELKIRDLQGGLGLIDSPTVSPALGDPHAGLSGDLDTLASYLTSLQAPPASPYHFSADVIQRGQQIFDQQGCARCHVGAAGTNSQQSNVGTGNPALERQGLSFDTPSLRWLWLSAPYFHDGSAATLRDVFLLPGTHQLVFKAPSQDIDALVDYLLTLPNVPQ